MNRIYLDHAAATPMRPEVRGVMTEAIERLVGNPSSAHAWGREARAALEQARERIAAVLGVDPGGVHFVRGGTESINLAILGRVDWSRSRGDPRPRLLRSSVEHPAVRDCMEAAACQGAVVDEIPVSPNGELEIPVERELRQAGAALVSVQWVNQETGMILPIPRVAELCREAGVPLHVDGVQAAGKIPLRLDRVPLSFLSLSSHKLGGPRSTGALVIADGTQIQPRLFGGGQERGLRPGTEDLPGALGLATALEMSVDSLGAEGERIAELRDRLEAALVQKLPRLRVHGTESPRAPHILSVGAPGIPRDLLIGALDLAGIGASAGSACRSGAVGVSHVLRALYGSDAEGIAPLRLSLGWSTTPEEVDQAADRIPPIVERMWNV